jgi:hypothetical protein
MRYLREVFGIISIVSLSLCLSCGQPTSDSGSSWTAKGVVVGHELAKESVLRSIPSVNIDAARKNLHVAYFHTSHGTHVSFGLYGLQGYKSGDETLYAVSTSAESGKLDFQDYAFISPGYQDLSGADADWAAWVSQVEAYLDDAANAEINVMMWSWCSIRGHNVSSYLSSMQTLIDEYGSSGSKIGTGAGKTRVTPVSFIFMTGHAWGNQDDTASNNVGEGAPANQAALITAYCAAHSYWCLDYYSIDSHDMDGTYYEDASDDSYSASAGKNFNQVWQDAHAEGTDWFYDLDSPGGSKNTGTHLTQYITANRKAYAMWYILAGIAAERGFAQ